MDYELAYRIPGKGGWKRKAFKTEKAMLAFIEKLMEREGDDVETMTRSPESL